ncbi:hypothetical protein WMF20_21365 [Sorangium sp. So ce834]|uniref:hypothetical protein n=1 Tax=Sorangium sp. So ce834 TaxID=3133321 RepID=UPI003F60A2E1
MNGQQRVRWLLTLGGLATVACIPDMGNEKPGVCVPNEVQCLDNQVKTCGVDYRWRDTKTCGGDTPDCTAGACRAYPASCANLPATCGPSGAESCCESKTITGGTFQRFDTNSRVASPATVSSFKLDRFEVTVGRFRHFSWAPWSWARSPRARANTRPTRAPAGTLRGMTR